MTDLKDEMTTLQSLGAELDPPAGGPPAALRRQVMSATRRRRRLIHLPASRGSVPGWRPAIAVGLAAAVAVGMWAAPIGSRSEQAPSTTVATGPTFVQPVNAAAVLSNASVAAGLGSDQVPGPNQFIFSESLESGELGFPVRRQVWSSVDGKVGGLLRTQPSAGGEWEATPTSGSGPWYIADLPTTADGMLTYLEKLAGEKIGQKPSPGASRDAKIWKNAQGLIADRYMPADAKSALFAALAKLPGAKVEKGVTDASGRKGVAVGLDDPFALQLVFDAKTYEFLATRAVQPGKVVSETGYLRLAIVDKVGQLP